jgi:hypothetical protein
MIVGPGGSSENPDPYRRPGSIRRTVTVDGERPEGFAGPVSIRGLGRDLLTDSNGVARELGAVSLAVSVGPGPGYTILDITADPPVRGLDQLVGSSAHVGLRRRLGELDVPRGSSLALRILQDLPAVTTLSRLASIHQGETPYLVQSGLSGLGEARIDICAGWAADSTMNRMISSGLSPVHDHDDAPAPPIGADDAHAWHQAPALEPGRFRRRRRLDVGPAAGADLAVDPDLVEIDSMFRDTFVGSDGAERVEHEYRLSALVDRQSGTILASEAVPINLPAPECPHARGSASLVVGQAVSDLSAARRDLVGPSTCTHLTQALLADGDAADLLAALSRA